MCGLILFYPKIKKSRLSCVSLSELIKIFKKSSRRGTDAAGILVSIKEKNKRYLNIFKVSDNVDTLLTSKEFIDFCDENPIETWEFAFGHTRMNTDGNAYELINNQPLVQDKDVLVFNGIIINSEDFGISRLLNDGYSLFEKSLSDEGLVQHKGIINCIRYNNTQGTIELFSRNQNLFMHKSDVVLVASEPTFISKETEVLKKITLRIGVLDTKLNIYDVSPKRKPVAVGNVDYKFNYRKFDKEFLKIKEFHEKNNTRCTSCVLPSTHPFIYFDELGVCNFCNNHKPVKHKDPIMFKQKIDEYRSGKVLLGLSGGRDSSLALHHLVNKYGIRPITYTYDWGVNTELSRRNVSRMCGALRVENVLISADLRKKRENVKLNLNAWLKRPTLGIMPLLMAGDKQFISNAAMLKKERNIDLEIFAFNLHEKTQFKEELTGIKMWGDAGDTYGEQLALFKQLKLLYFYGKEALLNPALINRSIYDSLKGFLNYYHSNVDVVQFFEYHDWNEKELNSTLSDCYDWEFAEDTPTSWRIGDGTAAFYNLAYYLQLGFTENDVIRSNLIRAGQINRAEALALVEIENQPRFPTLQWYCKIIDIDLEKTLDALFRGKHNAS